MTMQSPSKEQSPRRVAAHHKENIAKRPWHRNMVLCCFAGSSKPDDVDDPFEPSAAPAEHSPPVGAPLAAVNCGTRVQSPTAATGNSTAPVPAATTQSIPPATAELEATPPRAEGPTTNLLDESITDPSLPLFESNSNTAGSWATARHHLSLGSPLVTPSSSHHAPPAAAAPAAAPAAAGSRAVTSAEDLEPDSTSSSRGVTLAAQPAAQEGGPAEGFTHNHLPDGAAAAVAEQQGQQPRSNSPFLSQQHQSTVTAQLMGMQMQQYRAQHPPEQPQQQQHNSLEQQQQGDVTAKHLAPAGTLGAVPAAAGTAAPVAGNSHAEHVLPALFSRSVAGWDSDRTAAAATTAPGSSVVAAAAGQADAGRATDRPELRVCTSTPKAAELQQQQQQQCDISSQRDQGLKQYRSDLPPRSPRSGLKPLSVLMAETSNDASPFVQQQQRQSAEQDSSSWNVVPMTAGMPPLSPLRIPSSNENSRNLLQLISHNGVLNPDLEDSPQSPRASVVGVNNSVINNLLSEDGMPLVPTEPGLEESLMDPVPETLEVTPETPKRVRSFLNLASMSGTSGRWSGSRDQVPETPRTSLSGTWSGSGRDQLHGLGASPLRAGQIVRNVRGERQLMGGTSSVHAEGLRGGLVSDSNLIGGSYNGPAYRRRSTAAGSSSSGRDDIGSWDVAGPVGLGAGNSSSSSRFGAFGGGNSSSSKFPAASGGRIRRGSTGMECFTPRAGRALLSFSDAYQTKPNTYSSNSMLHNRDLSNSSAAAPAAAPAAADRAFRITGNGPSDGIMMLGAESAADNGKQQSAAAGSDVDMSAADMAAAASFHMSPPDDPNPSHHNNIVYAFQPTSTTASTNHSSQSYRLASPRYDSSLVGEFSGGRGLGGTSSSSGQAVDSDRGLSTGSMVGSGALFSRSGLADFTRKAGAVGGDGPADGDGGVVGSLADARQGMAARAPGFGAPAQNPVGGQVQA